MHIIYLYESRDKSLFLHYDIESDKTSFDTIKNVCRDLHFFLSATSCVWHHNDR